MMGLGASTSGLKHIHRDHPGHVRDPEHADVVREIAKYVLPGRMETKAGVVSAVRTRSRPVTREIWMGVPAFAGTPGRVCNSLRYRARGDPLRRRGVAYPSLPSRAIRRATGCPVSAAPLSGRLDGPEDGAAVEI